MSNKKQTSSKGRSSGKSWSLLRDWLFLTLIIMVVSFILPGVEVVSFVAALSAALILGILNAVLKPLMLFLTLPINFLTLGLFTWVINAVLIFIVAVLVPGFTVLNIGYAMMFSIFVSMFTYLVSHLFSTK